MLYHCPKRNTHWTKLNLSGISFRAPVSQVLENQTYVTYLTLKRGCEFILSKRNWMGFRWSLIQKFRQCHQVFNSSLCTVIQGWLHPQVAVQQVWTLQLCYQKTSSVSHLYSTLSRGSQKDLVKLIQPILKASRGTNPTRISWLRMGKRHFPIVHSAFCSRETAECILSSKKHGSTIPGLFWPMQSKCDS